MWKGGKENKLVWSRGCDGDGELSDRKDFYLCFSVQCSLKSLISSLLIYCPVTLEGKLETHPMLFSELMQKTS